MKTSPSPIDRARRARRTLALGVLVLFATGSLGLGIACSSIESEAFSNGECVAGGCATAGTSTSGSAGTSSSSSSSSGAMMCVDAGCSVSWSTDIFTGIFDTNTVGCTNAMLCHGSPAAMGGIELDPGMASAAYTTLSTYTLLANPGPAEAYITPCDTGSGILCNMFVNDGGGGTTNPFGTCGNLMPKNDVHPLTPAQLETIKTWIQCGALNN